MDRTLYDIVTAMKQAEALAELEKRRADQAEAQLAQKDAELARLAERLAALDAERAPALLIEPAARVRAAEPVLADD